MLNLIEISNNQYYSEEIKIIKTSFNLALPNTLPDNDLVNKILLITPLISIEKHS
jgi:hypothetical protein